MNLLQSSFLICSLALAVAGQTSYSADTSSKDAYLIQWREQDHKIQALNKQGNAIPLKGGSLDGMSIQAEKDRYVLLSAGKPSKIAIISSANNWTIQKPDGTLMTELVFKNDQYHLSAQGKALARVKLKADKFNLYDPAGKKTHHGKAKEDGFSVKSEIPGANSIKIKGAKSLKEASLLALPISDDERLLFWALERQP